MIVRFEFGDGRGNAEAGYAPNAEREMPAALARSERLKSEVPEYFEIFLMMAR